MTTAERTSDAGFGIIEAIVALAIISFALPALYKAMAGAYKAEGRMKVHEAALVLARSQLDAVGSDGTIQPGTFSGTYENGLPWQLTVSALSDNGSTGPAKSRPYWIVLEAYDRGGVRLLRFQTAKLLREIQ